MDHAFYKWKDGSLVLAIRTVPLASRDHLGELIGDRIKIHITASPVDGKANRYLCTKENVVYPTFRASRMALIKAQLVVNGCVLSKSCNAEQGHS